MAKQLAILLRVQLVDIHGSKFYDLSFQIGEKAPQTSRIGAESVYPNPKIGDEVRVSLILGQLVGVEKVESRKLIIPKRYSLVLQFLSIKLNDFDKMLDLEDALASYLHGVAEVDGHDSGSGEINIFT